MATRVCKATLLKSMKKGKTPVQCSHKAKNGTDYCGYHRNFITKQNLPPPPQNLATEDHIECVICLSDITDDLVRTNCNHCFHSRCLKQWKKCANTCPCCRASLSNNRFKFDHDLLRDMAIRMNMKSIIILRNNATIDSYNYEKYNLMIEIRNREDSMNDVY